MFATDRKPAGFIWQFRQETKCSARRNSENFTTKFWWMAISCFDKKWKGLNELRIWKGNYYCCKWRWMRTDLKPNFKGVSSCFDDYELKFYLLILWFSGEFFPWMSLMNHRALSIPWERGYIMGHIYLINSLENQNKILSIKMKKYKIESMPEKRENP